MTRWRAKSGVLVTGDAPERFLTDVDSGQLYEANETAVLIFEGVRDGLDVAGIVARLHAKYPDVPLDELDRDVRDAVGRMAEQGLVERA